MKRNKRKIIVILTLAIMILQMFLPILRNVSYATSDLSENEWDISADESGNIMAVFDIETGTLTISGTGIMKNYAETSSRVPWYQIKEKITKVEIKEGITNIGESAFSGCKNLTEVVMPDGIDSIGKSTFKDCGSLKNVNIPETVTKIGEFTFSGCSTLESITIPNGVEKIENSLFSGCVSLTNVTIPETVTSIGEGAFKNCNSLSNITIPNTVTEIGSMAFLSCKNLTEIVLPEELITIGETVFKDSGLTSLTIPVKVTNIGNMAFAKCTQLSEIKVAEENSAYTSIEGVLYTKDKTKLIKYPTAKSGSEYKIEEGTVIIGGYAFDSCKNLTQITIPEGVTNIEYHAFDGCTNLTNITMPKTLKSIKEFAFSTCNGLTKIIIPNGVTEVGKQAFFTCNNLTEIIIPNSVTEIGQDIVNDKANIICATGSNMEKYAQENNKKHTVDEEGPKVVFVEKDTANELLEISIAVNATDDFVGLDESSLKYAWSTKSTDVQIDEITTSFTNGDTIQKDTETGTYYLWVCAYDLLGNCTVQNSSEMVIDNTLPTVTLNQSSTDKTNMTITVADIGTGLSQSNNYQYYISASDTELQKGEWKNYISGKVFSIPKGTTHSYYIFVKTISDNAKNVSTTNGTMVTIGEETYHRFGPYTREIAEITFSPNGNQQWKESVSIRVSGLGSDLQEYYEYAWIEESTNLNVGDSSTTLSCKQFEEYDYAHGFARNEETENGKYNLVIIEKETSKIIAKSEVFHLGKDITPPVEEVVEKYFTINEYITEDNYVKGILAETTIENFKNNISTNMNYTIKENGVEVTGGILKTGQTIEVENGNTYTIVVTADVDGNGIVGTSDIEAVNQYRLKNKVLEGAYLQAADANLDGKVDLKDISKINKEISN